MPTFELWIDSEKSASSPSSHPSVWKKLGERKGNSETCRQKSKGKELVDRQASNHVTTPSEQEFNFKPDCTYVTTPMVVPHLSSTHFFCF